MDVAIVGGGFTGLWTAYALATRDPSMRIALVEREIVGFGASGRNGGWASALFAGNRETMARRHGREAVLHLDAELRGSIDALGAVCAHEGIDAGFVKGGTLTVATAPAQEARIRRAVEPARTSSSAGTVDGGDGARWLEASEVAARIVVAGNRGAMFTPHCARIQPARLARGLGARLRRSGVAVHEGTSVVEIAPGRVTTERGTVRADVVVRATEGYTPQLRGLARTLVPLYSLMVATEPLPASVWAELGWSGRETVTDGRHLIVYAQRTTDDRIAFGGRGAPYHFASRVRDAYDRDDRIFERLRSTVRSLFPAAADARFTHAWGGPLGVPRDWMSSVGFDRASGVAWAGGYVGDGVTTTYLAGHTIADLVTGIASARTALPWVQHRSRRWEPEPLRWLGIRAGLSLTAAADRREARTGREATLLGRAIDALT